MRGHESFFEESRIVKRGDSVVGNCTYLVDWIIVSRISCHLLERVAKDSESSQTRTSLSRNVLFVSCIWNGRHGNVRPHDDESHRRDGRMLCRR